MKLRYWLASALIMLSWAGSPRAARAQNGGGACDIANQASWLFDQPLLIPPVMPPHSPGRGAGASIEEYRIAVREFEQQVLPPGCPLTTVWGYGKADDPSTFNFPAYTIEARRDTPLQVWWLNELVDGNRDFLTHLLPVDETLHQARPADRNPAIIAAMPGPVPITTHVHGAHVPSVSDGLPESWWLPNARNLPRKILNRGPHYGTVIGAPPGAAVFRYPNDQPATTLWYHDHTLGITRLNVYAGLAGFWLVRDDGEDAMELPGPAPRLGDAEGTAYKEIPLVIQDRTFLHPGLDGYDLLDGGRGAENGDFAYPESRAYFDGYTGPYVDDEDPSFTVQDPEDPDQVIEDESLVPPVWNPEFFGDTMLVNGKVWPYLEVAPHVYRFRVLNGCNSRFLKLTFADPDPREPNSDPTDTPLPPIYQIGNEGGFLPEVKVYAPGEEILLGPAERADLIIDFSGHQGQDLILFNAGPDEPYKGPEYDAYDPIRQYTHAVMEFRVGTTDDPDPFTWPADQTLLGTLNERLGNYDGATVDRHRQLEFAGGYYPSALGGSYEDHTVVNDAGTRVKWLTLNEVTQLVPDPGDPSMGTEIPIAALLGSALHGPLHWTPTDDDGAPVEDLRVTEKIPADATEIWNIVNLTEDAHPIHLHMVNFKVLARRGIRVGDEDGDEPAPGYLSAYLAYLAGEADMPDPVTYLRDTIQDPEDWERGFKDTVIANPGEVTTVAARFDLIGYYVWHCHILEHEDNEMMRPFRVYAPETD